MSSLSHYQLPNSLEAEGMTNVWEPAKALIITYMVILLCKMGFLQVAVMSPRFSSLQISSQNCQDPQRLTEESVHALLCWAWTNKDTEVRRTSKRLAQSLIECPTKEGFKDSCPHPLEIKQPQLVLYHPVNPIISSSLLAALSVALLCLRAILKSSALKLKF